MKLMQQDYPMIAKIEVELTQEKEMDHLPNRPSKFQVQSVSRIWASYVCLWWFDIRLNPIYSTVSAINYCTYNASLI